MGSHNSPNSKINQIKSKCLVENIRSKYILKLILDNIKKTA